jgi:hypothetical protein
MLLPALLSRQYLKSTITYYYSYSGTNSRYNKPGFLSLGIYKHLQV